MVRLAIVVTCTDRKSEPVPEGLRLRSLPLGIGRLAEWRRRLDEAASTVRLRDLYQGDAWSHVPRLEAAAKKAGFNPTVYVASAGLGLQHVESSGPAYSATFALNQMDSVARDLDQQRRWWMGLNARSGAVEDLSGSDEVLFVLSRTYSDVLAPLIEKMTSERKVLVVGGSEAVPAARRLPSDAALRPTLGGTLGSLNMRMALAWLERLPGPELHSESTRQDWATWVSEARRPERYSRTPLADPAVIRMIREMLADQPAISKTGALRLLRDSGFACEQRRFGQLFGDVKEGAR